MNADRKQYLKFLLSLHCLYFSSYIFLCESNNIQKSLLAYPDNNNISIHNYEQDY